MQQSGIGWPVLFVAVYVKIETDLCCRVFGESVGSSKACPFRKFRLSLFTSSYEHSHIQKAGVISSCIATILPRIRLDTRNSNRRGRNNRHRNIRHSICRCSIPSGQNRLTYRGSQHLSGSINLDSAKPSASIRNIPSTPQKTNDVTRFGRFLRYGTVSENELIYVTSADFCKPLIRSDLRCGDEFVYRHHRTERDRQKERFWVILRLNTAYLVTLFQQRSAW